MADRLCYIYFLVVGEKEKENGSVNVRTRDNKVHGERTIDQVKALFKELAEKRVLNSEDFETSPPQQVEQ